MICGEFWGKKAYGKPWLQIRIISMYLMLPLRVSE
jgi:hypothetical protein